MRSTPARCVTLPRRSPSDGSPVPRSGGTNQPPPAIRTVASKSNRVIAVAQAPVRHYRKPHPRSVEIARTGPNAVWAVGSLNSWSAERDRSRDQRAVLDESASGSGGAPDEGGRGHRNAWTRLPGNRQFVPPVTGSAGGGVSRPISMRLSVTSSALVSARRKMARKNSSSTRA